MAINMSMNEQPTIELIQFSLEHRLININESVFPGEQIHILGANGAGKSTLLNGMSGFLNFTGQLNINGRALKEYRTQDLRQQRAYFPQQVATQPILKVFQYLTLFHSSTDYQIALFEELCRDFQLTSLLMKPIAQLSGGEWQRVRIIATFLQVWDRQDLSGKFILFDEPTNNLDIIQQSRFDKWAKYFCDCQGTVIMSGHNLSHSYQHANRIWMLKEGKIIFSGKPEQVMTEVNLSEIFASKISLITNNDAKSWRVISFDDE
ncbi:ATP-binding cassette domain-containing protein [Providencia stuartii]|uniref:ATP-binding cassette domain-containing protein n=2 Tax=Morganellaceae TaxID=1903414 RepID=A0AAI9HYN1_PROST|nr:ATP-binding cassette domain-containing protein [Providencia stuartii]ELR5037945.1 ATP-binding cassette domain-containing protein [Providencia stuartii]ELR5143472.1 ATP-binding cassette domain-containing protein [Providencia stuartii]ELZ5940100.1 ATP-binding cassette domain-containing protein [Providencia stuartii]